MYILEAAARRVMSGEMGAPLEPSPAGAYLLEVM